MMPARVEQQHEEHALGVIVFPMICIVLYLMFEEIKAKSKLVYTVHQVVPSRNLKPE